MLNKNNSRIELIQIGIKNSKPIYVDFLYGKLAYRSKDKAYSQLISKAVGNKKDEKLSILDATAGLGRDAFVLASLKNDVTLLERSQIIATLLQDGLKRASSSFITSNIHMKLIETDAFSYMKKIDIQNKPDVIYLDPMYPPKSKFALVKKEMRVIREIVGRDSDSDELLALALNSSRKRVVVKRLIKSSFLCEKIPNFQILGKKIRFDVYLV